MKKLVREVVKEVFNQALSDEENIVCNFIAEGIKAGLINEKDLIEPWEEGVKELILKLI